MGISFLLEANLPLARWQVGNALRKCARNLQRIADDLGIVPSV